MFRKDEKLTVQGETSDAIFKLYSPPEHQGFPQGVLTEVYVAVTEPLKTLPGSTNSLGQVYYNIRAKIVGDNGQEQNAVSTSGATPINMTVHWGFNLESGETVDSSLLFIEVFNVSSSYPLDVIIIDIFDDFYY